MLRHFFGALACAFCIVLSDADAQAVCENAYAILDANFEGARMSSCEARRKSFVIRIDPENTPINPSPWYAFRVTPKQDGAVKVVMQYSESKHRYHPKLSEDREHWRLLPPSKLRERRGGRKVSMRIEMNEAPFFVAAQPLMTGNDYTAWIDTLAARAPIEVTKIGRSVEGRPLIALSSTPAEQDAPASKEYVVFLSRQHPPELPGAFAMEAFVETVLADTDLAARFRDRFHVLAIPLMNPDGVASGHWRHNANGVDLNRDWGPFTQPETRAVQKVLDVIEADPESRLRLMLDFHSTRRNVFYTQTAEDETDPPNFTEDWLAAAGARLDDYDFEQAERHQSDLPTAKNYFFARYGAPSITYEVGDKTPPAAARASAIIFAQEMMKLLLESGD